MNRMTFVRALLAGTALFAAQGALAQDAQPDASDATADATIAAAQPMDAQAAKMEMLAQQVEALQAQIEEMKAGMVKATPAQEKAKWASQTKVGGKAFMNVSSIDHESNGANQADNGTQTDVKRFYVSVDHTFDKTFAANVTTDFRYNSKGLSNDITVYVKKAYLQAKLAGDAAVLRVGAADLPWVPFVEDVYGLRYIENVLVDRTKYGTSTDWGVHLAGKLMDDKLSYGIAAINGSGYKTLGRVSNSIDLEGRVAFKPVSNIVLAVGGYTGHLGKENAVSDTTHRATRYNAMAAFTGKKARLGVEYFQAKNWNNVTTAYGDKTSGWSAFGSYAINDKLGLFGRYDWLNPNQDTQSGLDENYFNLGATYAVTKGVDLALVYKHDRVTDGVVSTSNGNIGGSDKGTYNEIGVWTQVKF